VTTNFFWKYRKPSLIRINGRRSSGLSDNTEVVKQEVALKVKKLTTQINGKFNCINNCDENK
jgi:hypothetical protein